VEGRLKLAEKERQRKEKAKVALKGAQGPTEAQLKEAAARAEANAQALLAEEEKLKVQQSALIVLCCRQQFWISGSIDALDISTVRLGGAMTCSAGMV
jgi:hypothetical protein